MSHDNDQSMKQKIQRDELTDLRREAAHRRALRALNRGPVTRAVASAPERFKSGTVEPSIHPFDTGVGRIDPDADKVVRRLRRHGHEAYLVGGCVRDLLLDRSPKDFDVATSASPNEVRDLFRNSRIIGRRFRLVHVLFGSGKVIETATFRRTPQPDEGGLADGLLIRSDNAFGEAHEDAARRDFTINGLFYDVENGRVLDWVGGMPDIQLRVVRTIGDPFVRFQEDPVRMLRAIKFSARLDLGISPRAYDAIVHCRGALAMAARPRLFEELLRLLREGASQRSIWLAWETGVLDVLLPELASFLADDHPAASRVWKQFSALDRRALAGEPMDEAVLITVLLLEPMREACQGQRDRIEAAMEFLEPVVERLNVPRRVADAARRIVAMVPRLEGGKAGRFAHTGPYSSALQVLDIDREARGLPPLAHTLPEPTHTGDRRPRRRIRRSSSRGA